MIRALTLLPKTIDPERLDEIQSKLVPSMKQADGMLGLKVSDGPLMSPGGPPDYARVIEARWESLEHMMAWAQTPGAQADKDFMIESGATLLYYEVKEL